MLRDVFYYGKKPNAHPREKLASSLDDARKQATTEHFWIINEFCDYRNFDWDFGFEFLPDEDVWAKDHNNVWPSQNHKDSGTWLCPKEYSEITLYRADVDPVPYKKELLGQFDNTQLDPSARLNPHIDMFFVDKGNSDSARRFNELKARFPYIQKTRYLNSWVDTINRCINRATSTLCWILNSELDYSDFKFDYYPNPWQMKMVHVFGTQWSHWGTTFLVNRESFPEDTKYVKVIEHLNCLNFIKTSPVKASSIVHDIIVINHGNLDKDELERSGRMVIDYEVDYVNTFKKLLEKLPVKKEHYVWLISTVCDYSMFDFTYICDPFTREHLHVFPSDGQKFGDTFLVNVNKLRSLVCNLGTLADYDVINFNKHQRVNRLPPPVIVTGDTHTSHIHTEFNFPYAVFLTEDHSDMIVTDTEPMSLWDESSKSILVTSTGGTRTVVPKEAKNVIHSELYDYPYITTSSNLLKSKPLDIIFFSNGEVGADENYEHLLFLTASTGNRVIRVDGVQGRVASQHAAANTSETPWYFLVNAKLRVNNKFDFGWQPDRLQVPKHYIFLATNPVNGLEYGHQAIVANNKILTLNTQANGLDFTMDSEHEVVKINSGVGMFNTSEWDTWRTAFREVIKLRNSDSDESKERLYTWLNVANGQFAHFSVQGAKDAVEYYESVNGDFEKLKLSYDWPWLKSYFDSKYK